MEHVEGGEVRLAWVAAGSQLVDGTPPAGWSRIEKGPRPLTVSVGEHVDPLDEIMNGRESLPQVTTVTADQRPTVLGVDDRRMAGADDVGQAAGGPPGPATSLGDDPLEARDGSRRGLGDLERPVTDRPDQFLHVESRREDGPPQGLALDRRLVEGGSLGDRHSSTSRPKYAAPSLVRAQ